MSATIKNYWETISIEERQEKLKKLSKKSKNAWENGSFDTEKFHEARLRCGHEQFSNPEKSKEDATRKD